MQIALNNLAGDPSASKNLEKDEHLSDSDNINPKIVNNGVDFTWNCELRTFANFEKTVASETFYRLEPIWNQSQWLHWTFQIIHWVDFSVR